MSGPLAERLQSDDPKERSAACLAVPRDPMGSQLLEGVRDALGDPDLRVARAASRALVEASRQRRAEAQTDTVAPLIRAALRGPRHAAARAMAALTLAQVETPSAELLPALVAGLEQPDGALRWEAARTLVDVGRLHPEAVTLLVGLVGSGETPLLRRMAMHCLRELAPDLPEAAEALVTASRGEDPGLVRAALTAMAGLFAPPATVLARLDEAARGADPAARQIASHALTRLRAAGDA